MGLRLRPHGSLLGAVAALLAACSDPPAAPAPAAPVRWHALRVSTLNEENGFALNVLSPCRIALRYEGATLVDAPDPVPRSFRAGSVVTVEWTQRSANELAGSVVPSEEAAAGRTEAQVVHHRFGFSDSMMEERLSPVFTRPGRGRLLKRDLVPPRVDEDLPFGTRLELGFAAVVDVAAGEARLVPGTRGSRLKMPTPAESGDRATVLRLWLEVLPP
jgi:hypothetical protein